MHAKGWIPSSVFGPGIVGKVATAWRCRGRRGDRRGGAHSRVIDWRRRGVGATPASPGHVERLGAARQLRTAPSPAPSAPAARSAKAPASGEPASFDTWHAVVKTLTYRVMVTTIDFGANYVVIGELATAAGLSSLSLVAGPIAYFAHEAAWHYYGPASAQNLNPLEATVHVPIPGAGKGEHDGRRVSRASR